VAYLAQRVGISMNAPYPYKIFLVTSQIHATKIIYNWGLKIMHNPSIYPRENTLE
jgi:hypothetical protein